MTRYSDKTKDYNADSSEHDVLAVRLVIDGRFTAAVAAKKTLRWEGKDGNKTT